MQCACRRHPGQVEGVEDIKGFAHRGAAAAGRRHAVHIQTPIIHLRGGLVDGTVSGEIRRRHVSGGDGQRGRISLRRGLHRGGDLRSKRAAVEPAGALLREEPVCGGKVVVLEHTADGGCVAAGKVEAAGGRESFEPELVVQGLLPERVVDDEAAVRDLDGGFEGIAQAQGSPALEGALPRGRRAWDAYGDAAGDQFGCEAVGTARRVRGCDGRRVDERVVRHGGRCGFTAVDGTHPTGLRVVEDEVSAPADPCAVWFGHAQGRGRGDGGIRCIAALAQDLDRGSGCVRVHGAHRTAVPGRRRGLFSRPGVGECGTDDGAARHAQSQDSR